MPLVSDPGQSDDERSNRADAGGPPDFSHIYFDPNDPDAVKVHYDVGAWTFDQRSELSEVLAEMNIPHTWSGDELVVPEEIEVPVDAIFDALERELGPFPVGLEEGASSVAYDLDDWRPKEIKAVTERLIADGIGHRWEEDTLVVGVDDEETVDSLLDEIEQAMGPTASGPTAPSSAVLELNRAAGKLAKNPLHSRSRAKLLDTAEIIEDTGPPDGLEDADWAPIRSSAAEIVELFQADEPDTDAISEVAARLRDVTQNWL